MTDESVGDQLKAGLKHLTWATLGLFACLLALAAFVFFDAKSRSQSIARESRTALCTFRGDLIQRVQTSEAFLRQHPEGILGIPPRVIQQGIDDQRRTIRALGNLRCETRQP